MGAGSCKTIPIDASAFAASAGERTMLLGGCQRPLAKGFDFCQFERGATLPTLSMGFVNPADYAVSDCELGIFKTGSVNFPGTVEIDLAPLSEMINKKGFCILRVEVVERFKDPGDPNQLREIPLVGGFFIEMLQPGYKPIPADDVVAWCFTVKRTTSGRTTVTACK